MHFGPTGENANKLRLVPREAAVRLLANRIVNHLPTMDAALGYTTNYCRIKSSCTASSKKGTAKKEEYEADKYRTYFDFDSSFNYV
jgi:hypothetical protein